LAIRWDAIAGGGVRDVTALSAEDRSVTLLPGVLSTVMALLAQALPPPPDEPDTSRNRSSQLPSTLGALTVTVGATGVAGAATVTLEEAAVCQELCAGHTSFAAWHLALTAAVLNKLSVDPGRAQVAPDALPLMYARTEALSTHWHLEDAAQGKLNSALQANTVGRPPLLVLALNCTVRYEPSLAKMACDRTGIGGSVTALTTSNLCALFLNSTEYSLAASPDSTTRYS